MLPFTKRSVRPEDASDLIRTGDIEVVPSAARKGSSFPSPPASRPRVFARSMSDEEMTTLLPRKGMTFSSRPPAPVTPMPMPKLTSSRPSPRARLEEPPTRQFVLPSAPPASAAPTSPMPPPPSISPVAGPPRSSNRPQPQLERAAMKPQPVPAAAPHPKSDPRIDPPATVVTARTRIVMARPTMSWAAALVATGVFVGLVTAVVARGDADTLIDATASFVDPSGAHPAAAAAGGEGTSVQTKAEERRTSLLPSVDTLLPEPAANETKTETADSSATAPLPPRPVTVAYSAPAVVHHAWRAPARPAVSHEERVASNPAQKPAPAPKAAAVASVKPATHANEDDVESASAADALAKAQLEASLR
jgi:hypothetical protein